jgi:hypothetical protein
MSERLSQLLLLGGLIQLLVKFVPDGGKSVNTHQMSEKEIEKMEKGE